LNCHCFVVDGQRARQPVEQNNEDDQVIVTILP